VLLQTSYKTWRGKYRPLHTAIANRRLFHGDGSVVRFGNNATAEYRTGLEPASPWVGPHGAFPIMLFPHIEQHLKERCYKLLTKLGAAKRIRTFTVLLPLGPLQ